MGGLWEGSGVDVAPFLGDTLVKDLVVVVRGLSEASGGVALTRFFGDTFGEEVFGGFSLGFALDFALAFALGIAGFFFRKEILSSKSSESESESEFFIGLTTTTACCSCCSPSCS